jgi:tRNA pseudouridine32 synthase / 23S rRNA pseudouridine746 synthase
LFVTLLDKNKYTLNLPNKFTFPFYYDPHPLALIAAKELQKHIQNQTDWQHDFGIINPEAEKAIGKMFGVLVVRKKDGELGYLAAFSGKLAEGNHWPKFVPPVFDILKSDGFYKVEGQEVDQLNVLVDAAKTNPIRTQSKEDYEKAKEDFQVELNHYRAQIQVNKTERKRKRGEAEAQLEGEELHLFLKEIDRESIKEQYFLKDLVRDWKQRISDLEQKHLEFQNHYHQLKKQRAERSFALQRKIFDHYTFLNAKGQRKSLMEIFSFLNGGFPPSGSGECAAPKLLHYAFENDLQPICMAEFWWGKESHQEIRKHGEFYPACRSKCEPILGHMLQGLEVEDNPILKNVSFQKEIEIVYQDEAIIVVHKPHEFLSVPGKVLTDSVQTRIENMFPENEKPILVHRLDMSTSGLLLIAKSKQIHKKLQGLFTKRTIKKRYVALLDGVLTEDKGIIDLPLRLDIDNRPHQLVCDEFGKKSRTEFEVLERTETQTRVLFFPITGRTHQLRVHASHPRGLNLPIVGDDMYGKKSDRLYLHAEWLKFRHPITNEEVEFEVKAPF